LPFVLVFCGYAFILLIDKVIIDAHGSYGGHGPKNDNEGERKEIDTEKINNAINDEKSGFNDYSIQGQEIDGVLSKNIAIIKNKRRNSDSSMTMVDEDENENRDLIED
jgi:hypothetical protein